MESFKSYINKFTSTKLWYYIENLLVVGLFFYCIKFLTDYDNVYYQTWKNAAAAKAILAFTAIVFIIRKVKLLNWQSLVATLLFGAIAFERMHFWADAEDILNAIKPQLAAEWLYLMIIIDMLLFKNVNNLFKSVNYLAILYVLMAIGMIWRRHDRMDPIVLIFPMLLFALVKMNEEKKDWFVRRFIDGWFISYIYILIKSFTSNPYDGYRYYGCFINIGQFGIFMVCCFVLSISAIFYCKKTYGRKSILYIFSCVWLVSVCYMLYIIDTRTILVGVLTCCIYAFLYARNDMSRKSIRNRYKKLLMIIFAFVILFIVLIKVSSNIPNEWFKNNSSGFFSPLTHFLSYFNALGNMTIEGSPSQLLFEKIDKFTSKRLSIAKAYSEFFNFDGNGTLGVYVEKYEYWAYAAHNTYLQFLVEYGYLSLVELLILIVMTISKQVKVYLSSENNYFNLLPILWFGAMIGVWLGESDTFFYPITFFGFMFISRLLSLEKE